ncbi:MAG: cbiG [Clostridia bacterium]|nr:cbiG [Clostridia bacterium]
MKLACIAFTDDGLNIAEQIRRSQCFEADIFDKLCYKERLQDIFNMYKGIVFIGSTGIAVRLCAPFLVHKTIDPAVVVVDDLGRFSISLVSGHLGGANALALSISEVLQCQPVITTASDGRNIEAIDMFAKNNQLFIESLDAAKKLTALMIEGKPIKLESELKHELKYSNLSDVNYEGVVFVSSKHNISSPKPYCVLRPKNINIGIGCRRGKSKDEILKAIKEVFTNNNICLRSINKIATVDVKSDEVGIIEVCEELECKMVIFNREEISKVEDKFSASDFVKSSIGVTSVCEPCAYLAGGEIIVPRTVKNGITIAISKEM